MHAGALKPITAGRSLLTAHSQGMQVACQKPVSGTLDRQVASGCEKSGVRSQGRESVEKNWLPHALHVLLAPPSSVSADPGPRVGGFCQIVW
jgi:hypothetical protein